MLDCRLNDPNISVEIYRKGLADQTFQRVDPLTDIFVKQNGQNFTITGLATGGQFNFQCRTTGQAGAPVLKKEVTIQRAQGLKQQ